MTDEAPHPASAFETWVRPHIPAMEHLAARLAPSADRDDIVQEALARAWLKRLQYDSDRGSPAAWLLAITADQAHKAARRRAQSHHRVVHPEIRPARATDELMDVERAMRRLTPRQRFAVNCYYFVGLSIGETAAVMRCAEGTVKSTLADARAVLRTLLEVSE